MAFTKSELKQIKGCLEVRAKVNSRMGASDTIIPAGTVGYVTSSRPGSDQYVVFWPTIKRRHAGDWRSGVHTKGDMEPTGNRG